MRHRKRRSKLNKRSGHRRCMFANMLKSLVLYGKIKTTLAKAKQLQPLADKLMTLAKKNDLASIREVVAWLMIKKPKFARWEVVANKKIVQDADNPERPFLVADRKVIAMLFNGNFQKTFKERNGGYTRIIHAAKPRRGDATPICYLEFV